MNTLNPYPIKGSDCLTFQRLWYELFSDRNIKLFLGDIHQSFPSDGFHPEHFVVFSSHFILASKSLTWLVSGFIGFRFLGFKYGIILCLKYRVGGIPHLTFEHAWNPCADPSLIPSKKRIQHGNFRLLFGGKVPSYDFFISFQLLDIHTLIVYVSSRFSRIWREQQFTDI